MQGKPLWIGLAVVWMLAGLALALVLTLPQGQSQVATVGELPAEKPANSLDTDPLHATEHPLPDAPTPTPPTQPDPAAKPASEPTPEIVPEPEPGTEHSGRPDLVVGSSSSSEPTSYGDVRVTAGGTLTLPTGEVSVSGDFRNDGIVHGTATALVFDGADQTLEGNVTAKKVVLRGGTKRIRGNFGTTHGGDAQPGQAGLYVEAGTTLIIEKGGKWTTPNPYGFQVAGNLVIDGGEFHCKFSNGNGTDRGEESWLAGSTLTIHSGKFIGGGDADFSGCAITIHDGALEINDDIWNAGDSLDIYGGHMRNTTGGGMFQMTGTVNVRGGKLMVYQNSGRSLRVTKDASVYCTGGEISINGSASTGADGGILLGSSVTVPDLVINANTKIHKDSAASAYLSVAGDLSIAKGRKFEAMGFQVISNFTPNENTGELVP